MKNRLKKIKFLIPVLAAMFVGRLRADEVKFSTVKTVSVDDPRDVIDVFDEGIVSVNADLPFVYNGSATRVNVELTVSYTVSSPRSKDPRWIPVPLMTMQLNKRDLKKGINHFKFSPVKLSELASQVMNADKKQISIFRLDFKVQPEGSKSAASISKMIRVVLIK